MRALVKYDAACRALAEARAVDEVMGVREEAERLRLYGRQAKNRELIADATEILLRAERRLGQLLALAKDAGQITQGRKAENPRADRGFRVRLEDVGISYDLSSRAQRSANLAQESFDHVVADTRERIIAGGARVLNPVSTVEKQERRADRERELSIVAQPPISVDWLRHTSSDALSQGRAAEHLVCADCLMRGWNAFLSGQGSPYDVVIEKDGRMFRLQVKSSQAARNINSSGLNERLAYSFSALRRGKDGEGSRLTRSHADIIACVALDILAIAYLPVFDCNSIIQLDPNAIPENNYVRTYDRPIRDYPLARAISRCENQHHYEDLKKRFPPFPRKLFNVIYADPPWSFETWSEDGKDRSADNHYPTTSTALLRGLGSYIPAANDAVLFLWATAPMLVDALKVMGDWGFDYKTSQAWVKDKSGTGYWSRNKHELLLIGTRGNIPAPAPGTQWSSVIEASVGRHSAKPEEFYKMIESYFPSLSKIELFARGAARPGWDAWGNEADGAR